jgi:organic hydroperoxide reductase OsmC/OhrA
VEGLEGVDASSLGEIGRTVERECTISTAIRGSVEISYDIVSA